MKLYSYFRSSAAYRVRIALELKGLAAEQAHVHLLADGGQQFKQEYAALNPQHLLPTLTDGDAVLTQSLAILEYLEECHPKPALLPADPRGRAAVRAIALAVACDIHPLNNLRVLKYLTGALGVSDEQKQQWYRHWVADGLAALEKLVSAQRGDGRYCHGDAPTIADCCLIPQLYNARRFGCDLGAYPTLLSIDAHCATLPAFHRAAPEQQADAA